MKSPTIFILFLLSAFYTSLLPSAIADVVTDTDGNILENGGTYYVLPFTGGIRVTATGNERCPLTVVLSPDPLDMGIGTIISSPLRVNFIAEDFPLNITFGVFPVIPPCAPLPSEWTVINGQREGPAVKIGAPQNAVNGWFKIQKVLSFAYKLVFCPLLENSTCRDIGIRIDRQRNRRLVLTKDDPLLVQFQKFGSPLAQNNLVLPRSE